MLWFEDRSNHLCNGNAEDEMRVLVLVADYPRNDGSVALMYVHVRNKYYMQHGIKVTVINFATQEDYVIDGISVISKETYSKSKDAYDLLICHAANIRNHYRFLKNYGERFPRCIFFFHGHEVLKINKEYPAPYEYHKKNSVLLKWMQDCYDTYKLLTWNRYFTKTLDKSHFVFVSNWLLDKFLFYTKLNRSDIKDHYSIIHNSVGYEFEKLSYDIEGAKEYDFITIRSYLDDSKYSVDIVNDLAHRNPSLKFLLIGKGKFFQHNKKAENLTWLDTVLQHNEITTYLNKARCGLLPTREDTQGVMTCEMAAFGIPVITSDIDVCKEICKSLGNVYLMDNHNLEFDLGEVLRNLTSRVPYEKNDTYFSYCTLDREVELIHNKLPNV